MESSGAGVGWCAVDGGGRTGEKGEGEREKKGGNRASLNGERVYKE